MIVVKFDYKSEKFVRKKNTAASSITEINKSKFIGMR